MKITRTWLGRQMKRFDVGKNLTGQFILLLQTTTTNFVLISFGFLAGIPTWILVLVAMIGLAFFFWSVGILFIKKGFYKQQVHYEGTINPYLEERFGNIDKKLEELECLIRK